MRAPKRCPLTVERSPYRSGDTCVLRNGDGSKGIGRGLCLRGEEKQLAQYEMKSLEFVATK
jgi:hypothetical protein